MESDAGEADGDTEKQIKIKAENQPVNLNLMSTVLNTDGAELEIPRIVGPGISNALSSLTEWNPQVTGALRDGSSR